MQDLGSNCSSCPFNGLWKPSLYSSLSESNTKKEMAYPREPLIILIICHLEILMKKIQDLLFGI